MLIVQQTYPITASTNIVWKARSLPSCTFSGSERSGLQSPNTIAGTKMPKTRDTLRMRVNSWVTPPRVYAVNQFDEIFVWQLRMKGRPIPAMTCPAMANQNPWLMSMRMEIPIMQRAQPIEIPTRVPQVSMKQAAGKVKMGCMSTKSSPAKLTTTGDSPYISARQAAMGVKVLTRMAVIIWARANRATTKNRLGYTRYSSRGASMIHQKDYISRTSHNARHYTHNTHYEKKRSEKGDETWLKIWLFWSPYNCGVRLQYLLYCQSLSMSHLTTIQKARKILSTYDEIEPRKYCLQPHPSSHSKSKSKRPSSSISHSASSLRRDFSFCRSRKQSPSPVRKQPSNPSFSSPYGRQTRYDKIMKLKVKPALRQAKQERNKQSVLSGSRSSISSQNKENKVRNKSRLERIMNLKVAKPQVASTLTNYHPPQGMKTQPKQRAESAAKEWRQSQQRMRRSKEQEQREERLWKVFERERQIRCQLKKRAEQRAQKQQRRRQQRFQSMVGRQVAKLQRERELSKRKSEGFTNYVYPFF